MVRKASGAEAAPRRRHRTALQLHSALGGARRGRAAAHAAPTPHPPTHGTPRRQTAAGGSTDTGPQAAAMWARRREQLRCPRRPACPRLCARTPHARCCAGRPMPQPAPTPRLLAWAQPHPRPANHAQPRRTVGRGASELADSFEDRVARGTRRQRPGHGAHGGPLGPPAPQPQAVPHAKPHRELRPRAPPWPRLDRRCPETRCPALCLGRPLGCGRPGAAAWRCRRGRLRLLRPCMLGAEAMWAMWAMWAMTMTMTMRRLQYWGLNSRRGARQPDHRPANTGKAPQQHQLSPAEPSKHSNCHERTEKP